MSESKNSRITPRYARKIKELRVDRKLTQNELAKKAGISESALRSYELGNRNPKPEVLDHIAKALKVRPEYLSAPECNRRLEFTYILLENGETEGYTITIIDDHPAIIASEGTAGNAFDELLNEWSTMKEKFEAGEITDVEYKEWKRTYEGASQANTPNSKSPQTGK